MSNAVGTDLGDIVSPDVAPAVDQARRPAGTLAERARAHDQRRRRRRRRRRMALVWLPLAIVAVLAIAGVLAAVRGLGMVDEANAIKAEILDIANAGTEAGFNFDRATYTELDRRLVAATQRFETLRDQVASDPVVGLLRAVPLAGPQVRGADQVLAAAGGLLAVGKDAMSIAARYVEIHEAQSTDPRGRSVMAELVALMVSSQDTMRRIDAGLAESRAKLDAVPGGLAGPIENARVLMLGKIDEYAPLLKIYLEVDRELPLILGWDEPRRYLVLAQDPAELRPSGGFIGTYGIVVFDKGRLAERSFKDIYTLDSDKTYAYIEPPLALQGHLLGSESWALSDSTWSPHFPTAAQDALRIYTNESGDARIDGVIAITTYAIDELLEATGPIEVPTYGVTVEAGQTTLTALRETRLPPEPGVNRKAFLDAFAAQLVDSLLGLPPAKWPGLIDQLEDIRVARDAMFWLVHPPAQELVTGFGWDGSVRSDPGDYLYVVDTNVAPVSKLNFVTNRATDLEVLLQPGGSAIHTLKLTWDNQILETAGDVIRALPTVGHLHILGTYARVLVPETSSLESVGGGSVTRITGAESVEQEAGRMIYGNYLSVPPGVATLVYRWTSWGVVERDDAGTTYSLTIQKQPGVRNEAVTVSIVAPEGHRIVEASSGVPFAGQTARVSLTLDEDYALFVRFEPDEPVGSLPPAPASPAGT